MKGGVIMMRIFTPVRSVLVCFALGGSLLLAGCGGGQGEGAVPPLASMDLDTWEQKREHKENATLLGAGIALGSILVVRSIVGPLDLIPAIGTAVAATASGYFAAGRILDNSRRQAQLAVASAVVYGPGKSYRWEYGAASGTATVVSERKDARRDGETCRIVRHVFDVDGRTGEETATACSVRGGRQWEFVNA